ncbi:tripartite tricarboxylate transporter TctB family protein [Pseudonocardia thermophila]|uniref:tripartite tricarboxylate transporter TctB family protein n=1 Tax=Pseudonocardia thermophila TaxID=1848 RepID=UPI00248E08BF|nr:tripartite tricarboxylate transporter TctB family protein [Pseudonocardia thermophila]
MTTSAPVRSGVARGRRPTDAAVDVVLAAALLGLFVWGFVAAGEWTLRAALFPCLVTAAGGGLSLLLLGQTLLRLRRPASIDPDGPPDPDDPADHDDAEHVLRTAGPAAWGQALGWVAGFFVLLQAVGLYLAAPVFSLAYLRFAARRTLIFSAIYAVVIAFALYAVFHLVLGVPVPVGLLVE